MRRLVLASAVLLILAPTARAHDDTGIITIDRAAAADSAIDVDASIIYSGDREPAEDATVTAVAELPSGEIAGPTELVHAGGGLYSGRIDLPQPGDWLVRVTSLSPGGTAETTVAVAAPATTSTSAEPSTTTSTPTSTTEPDDEPPSSKQNPLIPIISLAAIAVLIAVVWVGVRRGRADRQEA